MEENLKIQQENQIKNRPNYSMGVGRIPPQAIDAEEATLCAILIDNRALDKVMDKLKPDMFYDSRHQVIFETIIDLSKDDDNRIDILTVSNRLKEGKIKKIQKAGGERYIISLSTKVGSSANIEYHAHIVIQKYIQRELINISSNIINDAFNNESDVLNLLENSEQKIFEINQGIIKKDFIAIQNILDKTVENIKEIKNESGISGLKSGFNKIDDITGGWQSSDLVVIAARPGMGKTAFILSMARNMSIEFDYPIGIFSLEMAAKQLVIRMISSETGISGTKLMKGNLDDSELELLNTKSSNLNNAKIYIDDTSALSIFDLRAKARRLKSMHNVKAIFIDYIQLMTHASDSKSFGNREQEISMISRNIKALAKELDITIFALSQLSRDVEKRSGEKRPILSDLRESGAIEQDADIVSFLYRPEYYKLDTWDDTNEPCINEAEFIIAKHRNGSTGSIRLKFIKELALFKNKSAIGEVAQNIEDFQILESKMNKTTLEANDFGNE